MPNIGVCIWSLYCSCRFTIYKFNHVFLVWQWQYVACIDLFIKLKFHGNYNCKLQPWQMAIRNLQKVRFEMTALSCDCPTCQSVYSIVCLWSIRFRDPKIWSEPLWYPSGLQAVDLNFRQSAIWLRFKSNAVKKFANFIYSIFCNKQWMKASMIRIIQFKAVIPKMIARWGVTGVYWKCKCKWSLLNYIQYSKNNKCL